MSCFGVTLIVTGSYMYRSASRSIGGGIVAENSDVCRPAGTDPQDSLDVVDEAQVEHLVGFVEHDVSRRCRARATPARSGRAFRPTVATTTCAASRSRELLGGDGLAAEHREHLDVEVLGVCAERLGHLDAELAGRREDERLGVVRSSGSRYGSIGSPNAAVFPVPVCAWPITSWPASSSGIACSWIGGRIDVAELVERPQELLGESELDERGH